MSDLDFIIKNNLIVGDNVIISGQSLSISLANISASDPVTITDTDSVIDISSILLMRSARYNLQVFSGTEYQVSKMLLVHDGVKTATTEYGVLVTDGLPLATFSTDILDGNVRLIARMNESSGSGTVYFSKTSMDTVQDEIGASKPDPGVLLGIVAGDRFGRAIGDRNSQTIELRG
jgi:hypothetical protein